MNLTLEICKSFDTHATSYEQSAKVQHEIGNRLFERLDYLKIAPRYILDLGCGTGIFSQLLKKRYRAAEVVSLDLSINMLKETQQKQGFRRKWSMVNANMLHLPFVDGAFDLVFSNQTLHWGTPLAQVLREVNRVMAQDGCLMFSTLGPDTFKELVSAWAVVDKHAHANSFMDMHDWGDALLAECFLDPVVDQELLTAHYDSLTQLLTSLKRQGVRNINPSRNPGLTGRQALAALDVAYEQLRTPNQKYPLTYEVVYGQAWKGRQRRGEQGMEAFIPVSQIRRI